MDLLAASSTPLAGFPASGKPNFTPVSSNATGSGVSLSNSTPLGGVIANANASLQPSRKLFELKVPPCDSGEKGSGPNLPTERYDLECEATTLALMPSGERVIVGCSDGSVRKCASHTASGLC